MHELLESPLDPTFDQFHESDTAETPRLSRRSRLPIAPFAVAAAFTATVDVAPSVAPVSATIDRDVRGVDTEVDPTSHTGATNRSLRTNGDRIKLKKPTISCEEVAELCKDRDQLLTRKLTETISSKESDRLDYVVWLLEQIEDPELEKSLERLRRIVGEYHIVAQIIAEKTTEIEQVFKQQVHGGKGSRT